MTITSLRCDAPTLEPDDAFVARLAELAHASRPTPSGVALLGGTAGRSLAAAAAVAAIAAGTAAAAGQMNHSHPLPGPPIGSQETSSPTGPDAASSTRGGGDPVGAGRRPGPDAGTRNADVLPVGTLTSGSTDGPHSGPDPGDSETDGPGSDDPSDDPTDDPTDEPTESSSSDPSESPTGEPSDGGGDGGGDGGLSGDGGGDGTPDGSASGSSDTSGHDGSGLRGVAD